MLDALSAKLLDPDEKVRAAVCRLYSQLEYEVALHHVSESQWRAIAERGLDKKVTALTTILEGFRLPCLGHGSDRGFELYWQSVQLSIPRIVFEIPPMALPFPNSSSSKGSQ